MSNYTIMLAQKIKHFAWIHLKMVKDIELALTSPLSKDSLEYRQSLDKIATDNVDYGKTYLKPLSNNYKRITTIANSIERYNNRVEEEIFQAKVAEKQRIEKEQHEKKEKERHKKIKQKVNKGKYGKVEGGLESLAKARDPVMKKKSQEEEERKKKLKEEELKKKIEEDEKLRKAEEEKRIKEESQKQRDEMIRRVQEEERRKQEEAGDDNDDWED